MYTVDTWSQGSLHSLYRPAPNTPGTIVHQLGESVSFNTDLTILLMLILNRAGDRMLPGGTSISCACSSDKVDPTRTLNTRSDRNPSMKMGRVPLKARFHDFKLKLILSWPTVAARLIFIACLVVEIIQNWICSSAERATLTLHQGQGHRNDHEYISHAYVYLPSKFECQSVNSFQHIVIKVQVKAFVNFETQLWPRVGLRT